MFAIEKQAKDYGVRCHGLCTLRLLVDIAPSSIAAQGIPVILKAIALHGNLTVKRKSEAR